ncbi:metallophosphoesterase [Pseudoduganella sp. FT26W]|uniref:Metallophosphoesterase n=1 Tax=Duganella aquatilis TaxID=2666082 RepID=A0A844DEW9_9BURK|nr:metallophosphoesterase [Duganella aquatilis]MRW86910.1 metallophosphoesterase [Duganella aquatilis]
MISLLKHWTPLLLLTGCAATNPSPSPDFTSYVVLGEAGAAVARVLIDAPACPAIELNQRSQPMTLRAPAETIPLRSTPSAPADSKPAEFPLLTCEAALPAGTTSARVLGRTLPLPKAEPRRIVVIGDTGCRLQKSSNSYQACNDIAQYPFATVAAQAAAWKPDLVIHVGDYHYRENPCPEGNAGCAGSPWGYGWDAWDDDFFAPGARLFDAAPWIMARGNHENCLRGGQGYWRFLDPRPLLKGRDCNAAADDDIGNYSDPYAVPLGQSTQLLVLDTANTTWKGLKPGDTGYAKYQDLYRKLDALAQQAPRNLGVSHHPLLGIGAERKADGRIVLLPGDAGLQASFGSLNPQLFPPAIQAMLSGHIHLWQQLSFASGHPSQFVAGFAGTSEDIVPLPAALPPSPPPAPGAVVEHFSSWVDGFGFMTMERLDADRWRIEVHDLQGKIRNRCELAGRRSVCDVAQVN